ncbi:MAG: hypothetical protein HQK59_07855 [Deltaproteobacteria bacterium]|nr:hypothetical protein [Deltaproteobacteria bacterium]
MTIPHEIASRLIVESRYAMMPVAPKRLSPGCLAITAANYRRILVLIVFLLFIALFVLLIIQTLSPVIVALSWGDQALLEINVIQASRGQQFLGAYSRYGFKHLGPFFFYLAVPFYHLAGEVGIRITALIINLSAILSILWVSHRLGTGLFCWVGVLLSAYISHPSVYPILSDYWNPFIGILPLGAYAFFCAMICEGNIRYLPLAAIFGSFMVQTHLGYSPATVILSIIVIGCCLSKPVLRHELRRYVLISILFLAILWSLPFINELTGEERNLGNILRFFLRSTEPRQQLVNALRIVLVNFAYVPAQLLAFARITLRYPYDISFSVIVMTLSAGAIILQSYLSKKHQVTPSSSLPLLSISSFLISWLAVWQIRGIPHEFLYRWVSILGLLPWASLGPLAAMVMLIVRFKKHQAGLESPTIKLTILTIFLVVIVMVTSGHIASAIKTTDIRQFYLVKKIDQDTDSTLTSYFNATKNKHLVIARVPWERATSIMAWMYRRGIVFSAEKSFTLFFGNFLLPTGNETLHLVLAPSGGIESSRPGYKLINTVSADHIPFGPPSMSIYSYDPKYVE